MSAVIIRGDARALPLPDASVDLIVTSPPYWSLRSYTDGGEHYDGQIGDESTPGEYIDALIDCTREWMRVLKPEGSIFVNLGDKYAQAVERSRNGQGNRKTTRSGGLAETAGYLSHSTVVLGSRDNGVPVKSLIGLPWRYAIRAIDDLGLILRAEIIWSKPNGMPESVADRVRRVHEQVFHFTKRPVYFAATDEVREPLRAPRRKAGASAFGARDVSLSRTGTGEYVGQNPLGAVPGSVWEIATQPLRVPEHLGVDHFAAFPPALVRRIVLGWSPVGGLVVDPFGGSGTTALVADVHGRRGVSVDRSADYCRIARWRVADPRERARALGVAPPPVVADEQGVLFDDSEVAS